MPTIRFVRPLLVCLLAVAAPFAQAQTVYQKPSKAVLELLHSPQIPQVTLDPNKVFLVMTTTQRYPSIADASKPMLRVAGIRINPATSGPHRFVGIETMTLRHIGDGKETQVDLPMKQGFVGTPTWSPDGKQFAFTLTKPDRIELWVGDTSGKTHRVIKEALGAAMGQPVQWAGDSRTLVVQLIPTKRAKTIAAPAAPAGPDVEESNGRRSAVRTYEDLLNTEYDEALFDYHANVQFARVDSKSGKIERVGEPAIFSNLDPSPDGKYCITTRVRRPYSHLVPVTQFPRITEAWDPEGKGIKEISVTTAPVEGAPAPGGGQPGPGAGTTPPSPSLEQGRGGLGGQGAGGRYRGLAWKTGEPHTLVWIEAKPGGTGDHVVAQAAPFKDQPQELLASEGRIGTVTWGERDGLVLISEGGGFGGFGGPGGAGGLGGAPGGGGQGNRGGGGAKTYARWLSGSGNQALFGGSREKGQESGIPVSKTMPDGTRAVMMNGQYIFLSGQIRENNESRSFLDRIDTKSGARTRLFEGEKDKYETFVALLDKAGTELLTRREGENEPPNYYARLVGTGGMIVSTAPENANGAAEPTRVELSRGIPFRAGEAKPLTKFVDPEPSIRGITKRVVTYKRPDGVQCSFTLYLPPNYKEGTRLPTVIWAYPREFADADAASVVTNSDDRFTTITGLSHLTLLMEGYAILDNASMPIVGNLRTVNDTFIDQLVIDAKAAIDKAVELGVTDPDRVGVGGHSYGAFMTANLLAHSDLFRAGIARSGAYNRTLTPFGFQSERRTYWQAKETYDKMSPFNYADKIDEPILLIHGEADNNPGTFPIQSERLYQAIRGHGGKVRLVMLPAESHGYSAKESVEHVQWEMIEWFNKYVKNAPPREKKAVTETKAAETTTPGQP